jgi:hypothetical protein
LFQACLPNCFWSYAVQHAIFLSNRINTPVLNDLSPYQKLYNCSPDISSLKVFGSLYFASTLERNRTKLDARARKFIFLGFKSGTKGFLLLDLLSKHVQFHEHIFPYKRDSCVTDDSPQSFVPAYDDPTQHLTPTISTSAEPNTQSQTTNSADTIVSETQPT